MVGVAGSMQQNGEPSVEEILESIKKVIARDNRAEAAQARARRDIAERPADVLELTEAADADDGLPDSADSGLVAGATAASMRESLAALAMLAEPGVPPQIVRSGETSLEALTRELLRPALAEWLDKNLPPLVERRVAAEIALFRELHPTKPILPAILAGNPAEAFPAELLVDGNEPLAADFRVDRKWLFVDLLLLIFQKHTAGKAIDIARFSAAYNRFEGRRREYTSSPEDLLRSRRRDAQTNDAALYDYIYAFRTEGAKSANILKRNRAISKFFTRVEPR